MTETRLQATEEIITELQKLQIHLDWWSQLLQMRKYHTQWKSGWERELLTQIQLSSYRMKEYILRVVRQRQGKKKKKTEMMTVHSREKSWKSIFKFCKWAKLSIFYKEGTVLYSSAEEATRHVTKRGLPVAVIKHPESFFGRDSAHIEAHKQEIWELWKPWYDLGLQGKAPAF